MDQEASAQEVYYGRFSGNRHSGRHGRVGRMRTAWRGRNQSNSRATYRKKTNALGPDNKPSKCYICGSIYLWAKYCPENDQEDA